MCIVRRRTELDLEGGEVPARATWSPVQHIGGSRESVGPERRRHGGMEKQSAHAIVDGSEHMFSTTILLRRIGAS